MQGDEAKLARVVIPSPLKEPLTYAVPSFLQDNLKIGMRVRVPLGRRQVTGLVVDFLSKTSLKQVREILELLDEKPILDASLLKLSHWVSKYYLSPLGEVLTAILPPSLRTESRRMVIQRIGEFHIEGRLERKILEEVKKIKGRATVKSLARKFPGGGVYRALDRLTTMGAVEIRDRPVGHRVKNKGELQRFGGKPLPDVKNLILTREQQKAVHIIQERLQKGGFETFNHRSD